MLGSLNYSLSFSSYHRSFQYYQPMDVKQLIVDSEEKAVLEKTRLAYFANQQRRTFDMNYSPKLAKKYHVTSMIVPVDRVVAKHKPLVQKKGKGYNLRCLHQLYLNINRYDFAHEWTLFNYDFLLAYLLCGEYNLSDLLYQLAIGAHDPNGELRFLLKQLERSMPVLNAYPGNLSFELIYRLSSSAHALPPSTLHLLEQCRLHCPLQLFTDEDRPQCLARCVLPTIVSLGIDLSRVFVLDGNQQVHSFSHHYYGLFETGLLAVPREEGSPEERFVSFLCSYPYAACLSAGGLIVVLNLDDKQRTMRMPGSQIIAFINGDVLLISGSTKTALELWQCSTNKLLSKHDFVDDTIHSCTYQKPLIQVQLKRSRILHHVEIESDIRFNLVRTIHEHVDNEQQHVLLDTRHSFSYSLHRSQASLTVYNDNTGKGIAHNIDFPSIPIAVVHLTKSHAIAWLTSTSLSIFHPLHDEKRVHLLVSQTPIGYDVIHDRHSSPEFEDQSNFLACINQAEGRIDIHEWRYEQEHGKFSHRLLTRVQLDLFIDQCVFTLGT